MAFVDVIACDMTVSNDDNSFGITKDTVSCHLQSKSVVKHDELLQEEVVLNMH